MDKLGHIKIGQMETRRNFLRMLSASPFIANSHALAGALGGLLDAGDFSAKSFVGWLSELQQSSDTIASPDEALDVMDFEAAARKALPPAHFGYLATGVDDDGTLKANHEGYSRIQIRARRMVDVENVEMSRTLFGTKWSS